MKRLSGIAARRHGFKARTEASLSLRSAVGQADVCQAGIPAERLKTRLTFEISSQAYLWTTGRGRSRLIKH